MTEAKPPISGETQLTSMADASNSANAQDQQQRTATTAFPPDLFSNQSPSTAYPTLFDDATPSSAQMDQGFYNFPSPVSNGAGDLLTGVGTSLLSPSIKLFSGANGTPTGWSPRVNMFSLGPGSLFAQSPTSALPFPANPFAITPTGLTPQPLQTPTGTGANAAVVNKGQFKVPFQPNRRDSNEGKTGNAVKQEQETVTPTSTLFPHMPQFPQEPNFDMRVKGTGFTPTAPQAPPAPPPPPPAPTTGKGSGRRGRRPHTQVVTERAQPITSVPATSSEVSPSQSSSSTSPVSPSGRKRNARRPPPLQVSPRSAEMGPSDVPMSSFKLVVGAQKLCKFRRYNVTLTIPKTWRIERGLTEAKVMNCLLEAKCCRAGTTVVAGCPRCKCQPVVSLVGTSKWPQASSVSEGNENYTCSIRTRCSSSRDHLKSSLTLVIDGLPLSECIVSNSFVLLARDKSLAPKRFRTFEFSQTGIGFNGVDDDDDDDGDKDGDGGDEGAGGELPRKTPHRGNAAVTRRRQQRSAAGSGAKPERKAAAAVAASTAAPSSTAAEGDARKPATDAPMKETSVSFPPMPTFPPSAMRQSPESAAVPNSNSNGSSGSDYCATGRFDNASMRPESEVRFNQESGQAASTESAGQGPSPIQPSTTSMQSPSPCSTPTGLFCDALNMTNFDTPQMGQLRWLSPMMSPTSDQQ